MYREMLLAEIGNYNRNASAGFQVALFSVDYKPSSPYVYLPDCITWICPGQGRGWASVMFMNWQPGKIIYDFQAEQILSKKALEILPSGFAKKNAQFSAAIIDKSHGRITT